MKSGIPLVARLVLAIGAMSWSGLASAEPRQLPGLTFEMPGPEWRETRGAEHSQFERRFDDENQPGAALIVVTGKPLDGDFKAMFEESVNNIEDLKDEKPYLDQTGVTTLGHPARRQTRCCSRNPRVGTIFVAYHPPGSFVSVQLIHVNLSRHERDLVEAEFQTLIGTLDFAGFGRPPVMPEPPDQEVELSGLYMGSEIGLKLNPWGGLDMKVDKTLYVFDSTGLFSRTPPLGTEDLTRFCPTRPSVCGTYVATGEQIVLHRLDEYGIVSPRTHDFEQGDQSVRIGRDRLNAVAPADDLKLDGKWTSSWAQTGSSAAGGVSVSGSRTIHFTPDGRFTRDGSVSFSSVHDGGDGSSGVTGSSDRPIESGTYRIDGYTLTMVLDHGETETASLYMPDNNTRLLVIDGANYLVQE